MPVQRKPPHPLKLKSKSDGPPNNLPEKTDQSSLLHRMHQPQDRLLNRHAQPLVLSRPHYSAANEVSLGLPAVLNI